MLNLFFNLVTACYVFYQSLPNNKLILPAILMFIGGSIKYMARARALYLNNFGTLRGSLLPPADAGRDYAKIMEGKIMEGSIAQADALPTARHHSPHVRAEGAKILDERTVIRQSFLYFETFKGLIVDLIFDFNQRDDSMRFFSSITTKDAFRVIEAELNFFYDLLYTRAAIIHCPSGYIYRAISDGAIFASFACFYVLNKHGFHEHDLQITYALLFGAISVEVAIFFMIVFSDWTIARIGTPEQDPRSWFQGSIFIEFLLKFKSEGSPLELHILSDRWSKTVSQYSLIDSRRRKWPKCLIPLGEWLDDLKSRRVERYSDKLGELIFDELKRKASCASDLQSIKELCAARGKWALENTKTGKGCEILLPFICDIEYDESLLLWHIATELCYNSDTEERTNQHRESSKVLSDYMLYLMIKQPGVMSAVAGIVQIRFRDTCADTDRFFDEHIFGDGKTNKTNEHACRSLLSVPTPRKPAAVKGDRSKSALFDACILAKVLLSIERENRWMIMSEVWVELLAYAAIHCGPKMHAELLSKGGELVTIVWLLMFHLGLSRQFQ
ncbi:DUF4220 domain-containing protein, partial [Psidium guajava]